MPYSFLQNIVYLRIQICEIACCRNTNRIDGRIKSANHQGLLDWNYLPFYIHIFSYNLH